MAHFAQLDENNIVTQVVVVSNADTLDENGVEQEAIGVAFCQSLFGENTVWKQTSYNGNIRKNYAGIGYTYDSGRDAFIPEQPFPSWIIDEEVCLWTAPIPKPEDDKRYRWDEDAYQQDNTTGWFEY